MLHRKHGAYSLYKKQTLKGEVWYVRFWDKSEGKYTLVRSTGIFVKGKKGRRNRADEAAREMLDDVIFNPSSKTFVQYLTDFWQPDSAYARECSLIDRKPLSLSYIKMNSGIVRLHIAPYKGFKGLYLPDITAGIIKDWMLWEIEGGVSGMRINKALQAMRVPVRYAISRDELKRDPFEKVKDAAVEQTEKGVLTKNEVMRLLELRNSNKTDHLAVLLGALCGMRLGEVRGLHWEDVQNDVIVIRHNWQDMEGIKAPKCNSGRTVPLPKAITEALKGMPRTSPLIFGRPDGKPLCNAYFRNAINRELSLIGIPGDWLSRKEEPPDYVNEQRSRNISFHSLRHTYVTLGLMAGILDIEMQALSGHKSMVMLRHYSHVNQVIDYGEAKKKLETALERDKKTAKKIKNLKKNA